MKELTAQIAIIAAALIQIAATGASFGIAAHWLFENPHLTPPQAFDEYLPFIAGIFGLILLAGLLEGYWRRARATAWYP